MKNFFFEVFFLFFERTKYFPYIYDTVFFQKNVKNAKNGFSRNIYEHLQKKTYKSSYILVQNMKKKTLKKILKRNEIEHHFENEQKNEIFIKLIQFMQISEHAKT